MIRGAIWMNKDNNDEHKYDDIINLKRHISKSRQAMPVKDRAAQFSPFAALTGYDLAIKEASRITNQRVELDETAKSKINEKLRIIQEDLANQETIELVYFEADEVKTGGKYISVQGIVKKIDVYEGNLVMVDGRKISIDEILEIRGKMFETIEDFYA